MRVYSHITQCARSHDENALFSLEFGNILFIFTAASFDEKLQTVLISAGISKVKLVVRCGTHFPTSSP